MSKRITEIANNPTEETEEERELREAIERHPAGKRITS